MIALSNKNYFRFAFFAGLFLISLSASILTDRFILLAAPFAFLFVYYCWQHPVSLFYLLLLALPFSFEYNFSRELSTDIPDELLMLLVSVIFFFYLIYFKPGHLIVVRRHPLIILLLFYMLWLTLTVVFSTYPLISFKFLLAKCWYFGAFILTPLTIFSEKKTIKNAATVFALSILVVVMISLTRHAGYNFRFANINDAVSPFFRNHVNYSAMLVCAIPLFIAFLKLTPSYQNRVLITAAILILLIALFFAYARGAWLALFVGFVSYWLIKKKLLFISFLSAVVIILSLLFWLKNNDRYLKFANDYKTTIFHTSFKQHLIATYKLKDVSTAERLYRWVAGVRMINDNPVTGYGPNTFYNNYKPYTVPAFETWVSDNKEHSTVHNYFLLITIEQGIPGLIFFLLLLGGAIFYAQKLYHRIRDVFYKTIAATVAVILTMLIVVNFLSDLVETDKVGSIFFLCISMLIITDLNTRKESDPSPDIQSIS